MKNTYIIIRNLHFEDWKTVYNYMNDFTNIRNKYTLDEILLVEHYPIYTTGHVLNDDKKIKYIHNIPITSSNRGGKITYHGPGQQIVYLLLNLKQNKINIRQLLFYIEQIVLNTLYTFSIIGNNNKLYPGIYVDSKKICSIGLRIQKGCSLHGFALNVNMDLKPFFYIHPCGIQDMIMTQISDIKPEISLYYVKKILIENISTFFKILCIKNYF
ncbi:lipoyl(octanoyl) transferase LipB [Buchnera aphidicola]|uniref:lipoyl(octanoyl) transferase LipB n=1 Tax=Buchnera aphidicola TaxID=9 RepID=UPI0034648664